MRDYLRTAAWDRRLTTVEGERDCVFSELEVKLWAEGDGVCFPQKITLIYLLNEPTPFIIIDFRYAKIYLNFARRANHHSRIAGSSFGASRSCFAEG
jgi:hypothetical protein